MSGGGGKEEVNGEKRAKDIKVEKKRWTRAVPAWGRQGDFQLSLDGTGLPIGTVAHWLEGMVALVILRYLSSELLIKANEAFEVVKNIAVCPCRLSLSFIIIQLFYNSR